jgi:hypothetical protein
MHSPHPTAHPHPHPHHTKTQDESLHQHPPHPPLRHHQPTVQQQQQPVALPSPTPTPRQPRLYPDLARLSYHRHAVQVQENASEEERSSACQQPSHHAAHTFGTACKLAPQRHSKGEPGFCCQSSAGSGWKPRSGGKSRLRSQQGLFPRALQPAQPRRSRSRARSRNSRGRHAVFAAAATVDGRESSPVRQPARPRELKRSRSTDIQQPQPHLSPHRLSPSATTLRPLPTLRGSAPNLPPRAPHQDQRLEARGIRGAA